LVRQIRHLIGVDAAAGLSDGQLLERFLAQRDEAAVETLVRRYGSLVLGACRRVLHNAHAAEDAFQATFLVLLRKAPSLDRAKPLGNWLYTVAHRLALRARANEVRRRACEARAACGRPEVVEPDGSAAEAVVALEEELHRLPQEHRAPLVLCYLEGKTNDQAAEALGCPRGSMSWRLARARELLRERLLRRGVVAPAAAALLEAAAPAAVPPSLLHATVRAALWFAAEGAAPVAVSEGAITLAKGALRAMTTSQLKTAAGLLMAAGLLGTGATMLVSAAAPPSQSPPAEAAAPDIKPDPVRVDEQEPLPAGAVARLGTSRLHHGGAIFFAAYTPDGKALLTAGLDQTVRLWDLASGKELRRFERGEAKGGGREPLIKLRLGDAVETDNLPAGMGGLLGGALRAFHVALSPDGKVVAATRGDTVYLWDAATGKLLHELSTGQFAVSHIAFAADSKSLASAGPAQSVQVWDVATGKKVEDLGNKPVAGRFAFAAGGGAAVSADRKYLAWQHVEPATQSFALKLMDLTTGKQLPEIKAPLGGAQSLTFAPDGKTLAWAAVQGEVVLWDVAAGKEQQRLPSERLAGLASAIAFSPDGKAVAVSRGVEGVEVWEVATGKQVARAGEAARRAGARLVVSSNLSGPGTALAFSPDGKRLAASFGGTAVRQFGAADCKEIEGPTGGHRAPVAALALGADGKTVVTGGRGDPVCFWDLATGKRAGTAALPEGATLVALSADGRRFAAATGTAVTLHNAAGKELRKFEVGQAGVAALALSPDGKRLAARAALSPEIFLWDTITGKAVDTLARGAEAPKGDGIVLTEASGVFTPDLVFSPDGRYLVGGGARRQLTLWDTATALPAWEVSLGAGQVADRFAFSPDGRCLAALHTDGTVTLYETATGRKRGRLGEPSKEGRELTLSVGGMFVPVTDRAVAAGLAFAPDGRHLAVARRDAPIRLWDVFSGKEVGSLKGHEGGVASLLFTPDGRCLLSGGIDTTALAWDVRPALPAGRATAEVGARERDALWADLRGKDGEKAFAALGKLSAAPAQAAALVKEHLRPVAAPDAARVRKLIADLESEEFEVRQKAETELEALNELAEPDLRKALAGGPSLDLRQRLERLLARLSGQAAPDSLVNDLRAVELLELAGGAESRRVLEELARGAPGARLAREAKAAAERLAKRSAP
jgi:RNA polymerase sigma factor (sigma-70 family)